MYDFYGFHGYFVLVYFEEHLLKEVIVAHALEQLLCLYSLKVYHHFRIDSTGSVVVYLPNTSHHYVYGPGEDYLLSLTRNSLGYFLKVRVLIYQFESPSNMFKL